MYLFLYINCKRRAIKVFSKKSCLNPKMLKAGEYSRQYEVSFTQKGVKVATLKELIISMKNRGVLLEGREKKKLLVLQNHFAHFLIILFLGEVCFLSTV